LAVPLRSTPSAELSGEDAAQEDETFARAVARYVLRAKNIDVRQT